jgi:hypothetical protein
MPADINPAPAHVKAGFGSHESPFPAIRKFCVYVFRMSENIKIKLSKNIVENTESKI